MILLWGLPGDEPLSVVFDLLHEQDAEVTFLDQREVLSTEVEVSCNRALTGTLWARGAAIDLSRVDAVYLRPYDTRRLPCIADALSREGNTSPAYAYALAVEEALTAWCEATDALVINRPSAMASNTSKPYQASLIAAHGFLVPDTLITTDPDAVTEFWQQHGEIVYKSVSGVRSIVKKMTSEERNRIDDLRWCPTQFQQFIEGTDYRIHVVGEDTFASQIVSGAADYRYARSQGADLQITPTRLSEDVLTSCHRLAHSLRLPVAGIDLRRTTQGAWYCFEVNPSPGFTFYDTSGQQLIARAIVRLLSQAAVAAQ